MKGTMSRAKTVLGILLLIAVAGAIILSKRPPDGESPVVNKPKSVTATNSNLAMRTYAYFLYLSQLEALGEAQRIDALQRRSEFVRVVGANEQVAGGKLKEIIDDVAKVKDPTTAATLLTDKLVIMFSQNTTLISSMAKILGFKASDSAFQNLFSSFKRGDGTFDYGKYAKAVAEQLMTKAIIPKEGSSGGFIKMLEEAGIMFDREVANAIVNRRR